MAGVKGRSGRKPLPVALHLARGTYRKDRHGPRPGPAVVGATALQLAVPALPKAIVGGLRSPGLSFVAAVWAKYDDWNPSDQVVLHEVGLAVDTLDDISHALSEVDQAGPRLDLFPTARLAQRILEREPLIRLQAATRRSLTGLLKTLDLKDN